MTQTHLVRITVLLPNSDYRVYVRAAQILGRVMRAEAPDVLTLIRFNLHDRDANGVADDYLDAIRWPNSAGRVVSLRRREKPRRSLHAKPRKRPLARAVKVVPMSSGVPSDHGRN